MIKALTDLPNTLVGFEATGEVTADDFKQVVMPAVHSFIRIHGKINYLLLLNTDIQLFSAGAWIQDIWMGIKDLGKWNRAAIVSDSETIRKVTEVFTKVMPGEFKVFPHDRYEEAVKWASEAIDLR
ncbi:SpoIIAA family protein [Sphingobacterium suaedae]|uniref:STAS/SEC14 domain-containing protein n=1 Tax=Sphingobacterium suaedae TaxID=1686402 RepID=A0ABW5KD17_9SPHI